jgi:hypothetical protein
MEDLFETLGDLFRNSSLPYFKKLETDIKRQIKVDDMICAVRDDLMNCKTMEDIDSIILQYSDILHRYPRLYKNVNNAVKRVEELKKLRIWDNLN